MRRLAILSLLIFCLYLTTSAQQAANATLTGTITDPHGTVVSGVSVTATQKATGVKRETVTNDDGLYVLSNIAPGDYELRIYFFPIRTTPTSQVSFRTTGACIRSTLERGLDGRALPVEVRAGNLFFIPPQFLFDPVNGCVPAACAHVGESVHGICAARRRSRWHQHHRTIYRIRWSSR